MTATFTASKLKKIVNHLTRLHTNTSTCAAIVVISKSDALQPQSALSGHSLAQHRKSMRRKLGNLK